MSLLINTSQERKNKRSQQQAKAERKQKKIIIGQESVTSYKYFASRPLTFIFSSSRSRLESIRPGGIHRSV